jgi:hypothetical protein
MFSYFTRFAVRLQNQPLRLAIMSTMAILILAIILASVGRWLKRRRQDQLDRWPALVTGSLGSVLKVLVGLAVLALLAGHLSFQAEEFSRVRGGVTQRCYEAVKTIWGRPHIQREMTADLVHYTTHYYNKDGLEVDYAKLQAAAEPVGYRKDRQEHIVEGSAIREADHKIELWMNYRRKGGGWYPCFETNCRFNYTLQNFSDQALSVRYTFPLPEKQGLLDKLSVLVDGKAPPGPVVVNGDTVVWWSHMEPAQPWDITVSYHSRGLDHLRFEPGSGKQLRKYRIAMNCKGLAAGDLNYPIGCMTPTDSSDESGNASLVWNLDNAVTRLGMGVIVPTKKQEGYYVAKVLSAGPWGMVLLLGMIIITHLAMGRNPEWLPLLLTAIGYYLYYLLMAHVGDYAPGLVGGMLISGLVMTLLVALLQFICNHGPAAWATVILFILFCMVYPVVRISSCEGLLMSVVYTLLLGYTIVLIVRRVRLDRPAVAEACV